MGLGPIVYDALAAEGSLANAWPYVGAPLLGGLLAVAVYRIQSHGIRGS